MVEQRSPKPQVEGSSPFSPAKLYRKKLWYFFYFNNNFVASFARLAVNDDGTKLYLLTGADGKDMTGETYKLCVYDLTSGGEKLSPTEINVTWEDGVPQAMASRLTVG